MPNVILHMADIITIQGDTVVVTLFSNIIHEQNRSNTNLTNKAYPGYCKHVLCWRPPEKALAYLAGGNNKIEKQSITVTSYQPFDYLFSGL